ncbi:hypothetical protein AA0X95_11075 [Bacillus sp. 1P10SD]|uniref:hypothetical protein n=1 Tax=Bacillus sp. 1P10SD TaxID=3132265 RepID=UPI0039A4EE0D
MSNIDDQIIRVIKPKEVDENITKKIDFFSFTNKKSAKSELKILEESILKLRKRLEEDK